LVIGKFIFLDIEAYHCAKKLIEAEQMFGKSGRLQHALENSIETEPVGQLKETVVRVHPVLFHDPKNVLVVQLGVCQLFEEKFHFV
jgi:hypothetical protein